MHQQTEEKKKSGEGGKCRKLLLTLTSISLGVGALLLATGAVVLAKYNIYLDFITTKYTASAAFILALGIWIIIISAIGFYAALKTHYCLMTTFLSVMVCVVVMEVVAAVATFALSSESAEIMARRHMLSDSLIKYQETGDSGSRAWDLIQTELSCCGLGGPQDYVTPVLPTSCCGPLRIDTLGNVETCSLETESLYTSGCEAAFQRYLNRNAGVLGGVAVAVALFQVAVIASATILLKRWEKPDHCTPCY